MSQKVVIERVEVTGASPYLGDATTLDGQSTPVYSRNGDIIMRWLCDGWRSRYNQLRSRRTKWDRNTQQLVPLHGEPDMRSDSQVRAACSWLAAMPAMVLQSPNRIENTDWWAANKRRKTLKKQHKYPGSLPRFKSRSDDLYFVCWHNHGMNANYKQFNKHHGEVVITGQNPVGHRLDGEPARYAIHIRVRVSQPIRDYTSIGVNWTRRTLVFVNDPQPIRRDEQTKPLTGIDLGCAHTLALSDGTFIDMPRQRLERIDREIRRRQKAQARRIRQSGMTATAYHKGHESNRYKQEREKIRALHGKAKRIVHDFQQKTTTLLVRQYDVICMESLQIANMTRKAKAKPDPNNPGHWLPNGQAAKRGLNHIMQANALGGILRLMEQKTQRTPGMILVETNPAYTSQTCNRCGYCDSRNRESQATFHCHNCGLTMNADTNAAINIEHNGWNTLVGAGSAARETTAQDKSTGHTGRLAPVPTRKTPTVLQ